MAGGEPANPLLPSEAARLLGTHLTISTGGVIVAVSGGPDSVALMGLAAAFRDTTPRTARLTVATVDHGLRSESRAEAETVAIWAGRLGLPHRILTWDGGKPATRIQERAREARYSLLFGLAKEIGARSVLTAHTLDDQAETIIMRLLAGSGVDGLAGMPSAQVQAGITLGRPLLDVPKARLVATCQAQGWTFLQDPSNHDDRFGRVRVRSLMPILALEGLTPKRLGRLAARARRAEEALERIAEAAFRRLVLVADEGRLELDGVALERETDEIGIRVLRLAIDSIVPYGPRLRLNRLERLGGDLQGALRQDTQTMKATLGGAVIQLRADKRVIVEPQPPRRARPPQP